MKTAFISLIVASGILITHAQEQQVEVSPLSLEIIYQKQESEWHSAEPGLNIGLFLKTKEGIGIASPGALIGKIPLEVKDSSGKVIGKIQNPHYREDEKTNQEITCVLNVKKIPDAGNTAISLKGTLPVILLEKPTKTPPTRFEIKKDTSFQIGKLSFKVKEATADELTFTITSEEAVDAPFTLLFTDTDGKAVEFEHRMWSSSHMNGKANFEITYRLDKKYDKLNIVVDSWEKATKIDVPINLEMGLGAPAK